MKTMFAQRSKVKPSRQVTSGTAIAMKKEAGANAGMPLFLKSLPIQTKLTVNAPNDAYEQEADRVADQVISPSGAQSSVAQSFVQRKCEKCEQEEQLQRKPLTNLSIQRQTAEPQGLFDVGCFRSNFAGVYETKRDLMLNRIGWRLIHPGACTECEGKLYIDCCEHGDRECESSNAESTSVQQKSETSGQSQEPASSAGLETQLASKQDGGSPLPDSVKGLMESRMGYGFDRVRIHTDQDAVQMNRDLGAQAFTHGANIFFGAGKFNPSSTSGNHLLAHELTHVVQQTGDI